jgi:hypothetical protein
VLSAFDGETDLDADDDVDTEEDCADNEDYGEEGNLVTCSLKNKGPGQRCDTATCRRGGGTCTFSGKRCVGKRLRGNNAPVACLTCKCTRDKGAGRG